jgi:N-acetylglucosamine malate deacetylase 1
MNKIKKKYRRVRANLLRIILKEQSFACSLPERPSLIIAPHPDDETFACGGLIGLKRKRNIKTAVVYITDGESSHQSCCNVDKKEVGSARKTLAIKSMKILGVGENDMFWMGLKDGDIPRDGENDFSLAAKKLLDIFQLVQPAEVYVPHPMDGWRDHEAVTELVISTGRLCAFDLALFYYPVWMWHNLGLIRVGDLLRSSKVFRLDISSILGKKKRAIYEYMQQKNPGCGKPFCGNLPDGFVENFEYSFEIFFQSKKELKPGALI